MASFSARADVAVSSGGRVRLISLATVNSSCHSVGPITVRVLQRPHAGSLVIDRVISYPHFSTFDIKSYCNGTLMPHTRVSYQAPRGFVGNDEADVALIGASGDYHSYHFTISVVPGLAGSGAIIVPPRPLPDVKLEEPRSHHRSHKLAAAEHAAHVHKHNLPQRKMPAADKPLSI